MTLTVSIERMRLRAFHGVLPQEREAGNTFEVTVRLHCPLPDSDRIESTVSYADVAEVIHRVMSTPAALLETVAAGLFKELTDRFPSVSGGEITVAKLTPPISAEVASASVTLSW